MATIALDSADIENLRALIRVSIKIKKSQVVLIIQLVYYNSYEVWLILGIGERLEHG